MPPDLWMLYAHMLKSRLFEGAIENLWHDGLISGEMHLGTGEEAIMAGVVPHLQAGDAMALDHRGSAALLMRGVDPVLILLELLGLGTGSDPARVQGVYNFGDFLFANEGRGER